MGNTALSEKGRAINKLPGFSVLDTEDSNAEARNTPLCQSGITVQSQHPCRKKCDNKQKWFTYSKLYLLTFLLKFKKKIFFPFWKEEEYERSQDI